MKLFSMAFAAILFAATWGLSVYSVEAASLYIDPGLTTLNRGDSVTMSVRLDTDEDARECVNAVDGVLTYSSNIEPVDISIGDSIFNIWVERPVINREARTITFAGGIPNGYCGRIAGDPRLTNVLTRIVFRAPGFTIGGGDVDENKATISFSDESTAYLNDGKGTKASLRTFGSKIELNKRPGAEQINAWKDEVAADNVPPEEFSISLQKDEKAFSQKYYIVFNTTDKQTGIDSYQVMEEPLTQFGAFQWGRADAPWLEATSPYVLKDQSLNSIIRVKAIDKAGNEYISNLIPDESMRTISIDMAMMVGLAGGSLIVLLVIGIIIVQFSKRRKKIKESSDDDSPVDEVPELEEVVENEELIDDEYEN